MATAITVGVKMILALVASAFALTPLVPFASEESMTRLDRATDKVDFFTLANHYESQQNGAMCGPTTAVIVLNALRANNPAIEKPTDPTLFPAEYAAKLPPTFNPLFHRYTQNDIFDARFESVKARATFFGATDAQGKRDGGLQLRQLHGVLVANGLASELHIVDDAATVDVVRRDLRANLGRAGDYVIVNYTRQVLAQAGGGHISPLGAYDEASDSFLVLDVNANDGKTWAWVSAPDLVAAMRTKDQVENRGYLLVREGAGAAPPTTR
jgi:hypothetical protein